MNDELTRQIMDGLVKHRSRNEIIRAVCEQEGVDWPRAEQLVRQVETEQAHAIARKQSPLMIFLSAGSLVIGLILVYLAVDYVMGYFRGQAVEELLNVRSGLSRIGGGAVGIGMIVGGLIGLYNTVARYFET